MNASRRGFLTMVGMAGAILAGNRAGWRQVHAQPGPRSTARQLRTPFVDIGYEETGDPSGFPIICLHGFPDDVRAWDEVAPPLADAGYRVLTPYLRGYGPTRILDQAAPRTAEQAAIGQDLVDFADALGLPRFVLCGYDWGNRAGCITAALHPDRVRAGVFIGGYSIQNTVTPSSPAAPETEARLWYQWYFNTERGRAGLAANRRGICRLLWETWSPTWRFTDETFERTAVSFDNPDFVDVVIHSYRHRHGNIAGEDRFEATERRLAERPLIEVPAIILRGADDGLGRPPADSPRERAMFPRLIARRVVENAGHFMPREQPAAVSSALLDVLAATM